MKKMKKIKINFVDFWSGFNAEKNEYVDILKERYEIEISSKPDYIFCSLFGTKHLKYKNAVKILVIGENIAPDFNLYDYAIGFYDIKFKDRYLKYNILMQKDMVKLAKYRVKNCGKKFCAFVYSKNKLNKTRKKIFFKISEYKKVDSGGKYLNNIGYQIGRKKEDKINFQKNYKFIIACENQSYPEYNTEKLLEAFASGGIPIYWGDPKINKVYNSKAFVNCNNYTLEEVKKMIIELDSNDEKYKEMINQPVFNENFDFENQYKKFKDFLYNIFDKPYNEAKMIRLENGYYIYQYYKKFFLTAKLCNIFIKLKTKITSNIR